MAPSSLTMPFSPSFGPRCLLSQVLEWAQRILSAGEAFSGVECVSLRSMLAAQSSNFFTAYHSGNLEALHSMLEKELWRRLPSLPEGQHTLLTISLLPYYSHAPNCLLFISMSMLAW